MLARPRIGKHVTEMMCSGCPVRSSSHCHYHHSRRVYVTPALGAVCLLTILHDLVRSSTLRRASSLPPDQIGRELHSIPNAPGPIVNIRPLARFWRLVRHAHSHSRRSRRCPSGVFFTERTEQHAPRFMPKLIKYPDHLLACACPVSIVPHSTSSQSSRLRPDLV